MSSQISSSSSSSSNQNFSTYVVIYCGNRVLIAKKNIFARWFQQTSKGRKIYNNPGGKTKVKGIKEKANKEFEEETGLTIDFHTNKIVLDYQYDGLIDSVCTFSSYQERLFIRDGSTFAALYVQLHADNELEAICEKFKIISSWDNAFHKHGRHTSKYKADDELNNLEIMDIDTAMEIFQNQGTYSEWFVHILSNMPNHKKDDEETRQGGSKTGTS